MSAADPTNDDAIGHIDDEGRVFIYSDAPKGVLLFTAAPKPGAWWRPIAEAPTDTREIFVARAFNVSNGLTGYKPYTTDPWCVWRQEDGSFARWPHHFPPTHFLSLPGATTQEPQP